jgi:hypothetical protein
MTVIHHGGDLLWGLLPISAEDVEALCAVWIDEYKAAIAARRPTPERQRWLTLISSARQAVGEQAEWRRASEP